MPEFSIRLHRREDDVGIFDLQHLVYPDHPIYRDRSLAEAYWQWRYFSHPSVRSYIYVATANGGDTIAGMRPMTITPVKVGNRMMKAVWLTAVITHPEFRNQGIFSALVKHSIQHAESMGVDFAYTFPNHNSYPIYQKKKQWRTLANIPVYFKPLSYRRLGAKFCQRLSGRSKVPPPENKFLKEDGQVEIGSTPSFGLYLINHVGDDYTEFWHDVSSELPVAFPRNASDLTWRYLHNPVLSYELIEARGRDQRLLGYIVIGFQDRHGVLIGLVVDFIFRPNERLAARATLEAGIERLRKSGADLVCTLLPAHKRYRRLLSDFCFWPMPKSIQGSRVNLICSVINPGGRPDDSFLDYNNWFLTWGDTDNA